MTGPAVLDHWWPVTQDYGMIRANLDSVVLARRALYAAASLDLGVTPLHAPLQDCMAVLEPLSPAPTRELFLAVGPGWTVYFSNGCRGSDPFLAMSQLSRKLGCTAVRACATPQRAIYPSVIVAVYDTLAAGADKNGYRRSIAASNDGGRWVFETSGTPFDFEDTSQYEARLKRDRFTPAMLAVFLAGLGAPALTDAVLQTNGVCQGVLLHRPVHDHLPRYTLAEAKALNMP